MTHTDTGTSAPSNPDDGAGDGATSDKHTPSEGGVASDQEWRYTQDFLAHNPTHWGSLSWIAARPLIASINDQFGRHAGRLVEELRQYWCEQAADPDDPLVVEMPRASRFIVVGDTGEQDAAQYVVSPALTAAAADDDVAFMVIMSDVIYPSGDVNDYVDGFYKPYRSDPSTDPLNAHFSTDKRILGLPGNHDWYDGLFGFMYHFTSPRRSDAGPFHERPPAEVYAPHGDRNPIHRIFRILWRRASPVRPTTRARAAAAAVLATQTPRQPGPYFAIKTEHLMLFCIDTGIDGTVDATQLRWLRDTARRHRELPKILLTGKPLVVNNATNPHAVARPGLPDSVLDVVDDTSCGFVASIGGDIHNFQQYDRAGLPHLVAGGGGAFTHATHPIRLSANDPRSPEQTGPDDVPLNLNADTLYPAPAVSFSSFAGRLVPSARRIAIRILLFVAGVVIGTALTELSDPGTRASLWVAWVLFALLLLAHAFSKVPPTPTGGREPPSLRRALLTTEFVVAGASMTLLGWWLAPRHFDGSVAAWALASAWLLLNAFGIRWSGWWHLPARPPATAFVSAHTLATAKYLVGLGVAVMFVAVAVWAGADAGGGLATWLLLVSECLYAAVALLGWFWWRHTYGGKSQWWPTWAPWIAILAQAVVVVAAVAAYDEVTGQLPVFAGAWVGLVVTVAAPVLMLLVLLVLVEIWAALAAIPPSGVTYYPDRWYRQWGLAARRVRPFAFVVWYLVLAGWAAWSTPFGMPERTHEASLGLPVAVAVTLGVVVGVDTARRLTADAPRYVYKVVAIGVGAAIVVVAALIVAYTSVPFWPVHSAAGAAVVVVAVLVSVAGTHLAFLDAYPLIWDDDAKQPSTVLPVADAEAIIKARAEEGRTDLRFDPRLERRANVAFPGVNMPFGPLQALVSEIYSSHAPTFYKHFLVIDTDPEAARITRHDVHGDSPSSSLEVLRLDLRAKGEPGIE